MQEIEIRDKDGKVKKAHVFFWESNDPNVSASFGIITYENDRWCIEVCASNNLLYKISSAVVENVEYATKLFYSLEDANGCGGFNAVSGLVEREIQIEGIGRYEDEESAGACL